MLGINPQVVLLGSAILMVGAYALMGVSLGTKYWLQYETVLEKIPIAHAGLWQVCIKMGSNTVCQDLPETNALGRASISDVKAIRGLCISSIVASFVIFLGLLYLILVAKMEVKTRTCGWIVLFFCIISGGFAGSAVIHFMVSTTFDFVALNLIWHYSYSMYLAGVSGVFSFGAGLLYTFAVNDIYVRQRTAQQAAAQTKGVTPDMQAYPPPPQYTVGNQPPVMMGYPGHGQVGYQAPVMEEKGPHAHPISHT